MDLPIKKKKYKDHISKARQDERNIVEKELKHTYESEIEYIQAENAIERASMQAEIARLRETIDNNQAEVKEARKMKRESNEESRNSKMFSTALVDAAQKSVNNLIESFKPFLKAHNLVVLQNKTLLDLQDELEKEQRKLAIEAREKNKTEMEKENDKKEQ